MNSKNYLAITAIASTLLMLGTSAFANNNGLVASTDEEPRSDTACDQLIDSLV